MNYYSDPTASKALGSINREFSRLEKRAKYLCKKLKEGKLSKEELEIAQKQFKGIYKHILSNALEKGEKVE